MATVSRSKAWSIAGITILLFFGILGLLLFLSDLRALGDVISRLNGWYLVLALAATAVSYAFNWLAFRGLTRALQCPVGGMPLFLIAFASATVSSVFSAGGVSGMTVRLFFLRRQGVRTHTTLIIALVSTLLNNVVLLLFVVIGFGRLLLSGTLGWLQQILSGAIVLVCSVLVASAFAGLYNRAVLDRVLQIGSSLVRRLAHRFPSAPILRRATDEKLELFRYEMHEATATITQRKRRIAVPFLYLVLDWACAAGVLYACFLAVGVRLTAGALAAGFAVGIFVYLISVVPGGLGLMEGTMTGLYVSLGVPLENALVALLAYRILFYFIPFGLSMALCGPLLREVADSTEPV